ncbi:MULTISPECIES: endonuclease VIII [unclassified Alteromonas]|jgi:endonuclease-8|uniref:endonuclease VIII n=1 Tax=unclassified Alteromonas TaxID=2614992 RepID=UPI001EF32C75|nr:MULTISPECIES: endonuclease VIII [unclassified Alteromonas]MCG7638118.1 endonuclease VIII [Alteromonas sp. CNT1-28]MCG7813506.1 endonuclease VIII [Alteromonas sp. MCA-1]
MPEGPEIRRAADKVEAVIKDIPLEKVEFGLAQLKPYVKQLEGENVLRMETRGKALITHFSNGLSMYSHNQLYGVWHTCKRNEIPDTTRQLRVGLHTETHSAILYSASDISIWPTQTIHEHPFLQRVGPDVLNDSVTEELVLERLRSKAFYNRALSGLYLDQRFMAGLGNYLRSEILFAAGVHPSLKPSQLDDEQLRSLAHHTLAICKRSCETGGYTVYTELRQVLEAKGVNFEGTRFMVFDREEQPCRVCATPIKRQTYNGRRLYWCGQCQAK